MIDFSSITNESATGREWYGRSWPKYDPETHLPMLEKIFSNGGGVNAFLYACKISRPTFYSWVKKYPEFKEQYEISLAGGAAIWELLPLELARSGSSINNGYWSTVMRERYKYGVPELKRAKKGTTLSKMKAAWKSLRKGGITPQEFNQIASGLATESRITEVELQRQTLEHSKESSVAKEFSDEAIRAAHLVMSGKGKVVEIQDEK